MGSPFQGKKPQLVLAFDIGTTLSGVSYSILYPGETPAVESAKYLSLWRSSGPKVPSIIYYSSSGQVKVAGAETEADGITWSAEENGWIKAEGFARYLKPRETGELSDQLPRLPPSRTTVDVTADFLAYLYECIKKHLQGVTDVALWESLRDSIHFVLPHPNGWALCELDLFQKAAIQAGLVSDVVDAKSRITYVSAGEAGLRFAIREGFPVAALNPQHGIIVVDAGGTTIDVAAYGISSIPTHTRFQEIATPQCRNQGSISVTKAARRHCSELLRDSPYLDDLDYVEKGFDNGTKVFFRSSEGFAYVRFGGPRDHDETVGIRYGRLRIEGHKVASFFESAVDCVCSAVKDINQAGSKPSTHVIMVGGFSKSEWLYSQVRDRLANEGFVVFRPSSRLSDAVAEGAIHFYLSQ